MIHIHRRRFCRCRHCAGQNQDIIISMGQIQRCDLLASQDRAIVATLLCTRCLSLLYLYLSDHV
jgi:hypothetical protein